MTGVDGISLNGFGINYIHGFSLSQSTPIFLETGLNANFTFGKANSLDDLSVYADDAEWEEPLMIAGVSELSVQNINLQVPVNLVYRISVNDDFSISPFVGINMKLNLMTDFKLKKFSEFYYDESFVQESTGWVSLYDKNDMPQLYMGDEKAGNRFQMGWQIGAGVQYRPLYLGVCYGEDFIPAYKNRSNYKIDTKCLKINIGYTF